MKTYKELIERAFSARGQAAREKMRSQEGINAARKAADRQQQAAKVGVTPPSKQKALPPGKDSLAKTPTQAATSAVKKGGPLSIRAADKGGSIVKQKSAGDNSNKMGRTPNPYRYGNPKPKDKKPGRNYGKMAKDIGKAGLGLAGDIGKGIMKAKTTGKGQPMSKGGGIDAPKRGVYNG